MAIEFVGTISSQESVHVDPALGSRLDLRYVRRITRAYERAGFDKVLVPFVHTLPDTFVMAQYAASCSVRLGFVLAHRAGAMSPTVGARMVASLDQVTDGRVALHLVTGGSDAVQRQDGDYLDKTRRYRRTGEYISLLRRLWTAEEPFDHEGEFFKFERAWFPIRPVRGNVPVYFGGASKDAHVVAAEHADVVILWGEPLAGVAEQIRAVRALAGRIGRRDPRFFVALRPILAATDRAAWSRAHRILRTLIAQSAVVSPDGQRSAGFERLMAAAEMREVHDRALWMAPARIPGAHGNASALVGSPETVVAAMLDYVSAGVSGFVINGYDPVRDALGYGRHLVPALSAAGN